MREVVFHLGLSLACVLGALAASRRARRMEFAAAFILGGLVVVSMLPRLVFPHGNPGFAAMRLLAGILFLETPLALLTLAALAPPTMRRSRALAAFSGLALVLVAVDVFVIEPRDLRIRHEVVRSARLEAPFRIVVLSDVQTDAPGDYERRVVRETNALHPDLVILPGDYVQLPPGAAYRTAARELGRIFDRLHPPFGTFAVRGNVEHPDFVREVFGGTRVHAHDATTRIPVGPIDLVALSFDDSFDPRFAWPPSERLQVLFGHGPDFMLGSAQAELLVAGHTHGGQVQLPFYGPPLTLTTVPRLWAAGGHFEEPRGRHLVVSRGIGMERDTAPRFRFRCPPEIVVIGLLPAR